MARLLSYPVGLGITDLKMLSGPQAVGSGMSQSLSGSEQTFGSPFGAVKFSLTFQPMQGRLERHHRGWITALNGGANATRYTFIDGARRSPDEAAISGPFEGQAWSNGLPWSNGKNWGASYPSVAVAGLVALGGTVVPLSPEFWGHDLDIGDYVGFFPLYFGMHIVTEVLAPGRYRVWPPLRKALTTSDFCTLTPTLAVKLTGGDVATLGRDASAASGLTAEFTEVFDYDVKSYFGG